MWYLTLDTSSARTQYLVVERTKPWGVGGVCGGGVWEDGWGGQGPLRGAGRRAMQAAAGAVGPLLLRPGGSRGRPRRPRPPPPLLAHLRRVLVLLARRVAAQLAVHTRQVHQHVAVVTLVKRGDVSG
jgi:hypothetical protein